MKKQKNIVVVDVGASSVKVAEFSSISGSLELKKYGVAPLGEASGEGRDAAVMATLRELMLEHGVAKGGASIAVPGQSVFTKFVKCPPVAKDKLHKIVEYEAVQNVPFPIDEVVWDYHALSRGAEDTSVMLMAIKSELIEGLTHAVGMAGVEPDRVDVAPVALFNAVNYTYSDAEGCSLVVDVGARSTDLIFIENGNVFMRSIPVAGNALTQQIVRESSMQFADAEALMVQVERGDTSVAPMHAEMVKTCTKSILMRLNGEIARSVSFYKSQQGGAAPANVFLAGGSCNMVGLKESLSDKLGVRVGPLDVLQKVKVASGLDRTALGRDGAQLGELVGLALCAVGESSIQINLMPESLIAQRTFKKRQPLLVATGVAIALTIATWGVYASSSLSVAERELDAVTERVDALSGVESKLGRAESRVAMLSGHSDTFQELAQGRRLWLKTLTDIRDNTSEGIVVSELAPIAGANGKVVGIRVKGFGYLDKVKQGTAVRRFSEKLKSLKTFSDKSKITSHPSANDFAQEFEVELMFEEPVDA